MRNKLKTDKFKRVRGGNSRVLNISCRKCASHILTYQKDGPGNLRRMYMDRILEPLKLNKNRYNNISDVSSLKCSKCNEILAHPYIYPKEKRNAYRLFADSVKKEVTSFRKFTQNRL